jgi:hypothetical protein
MRCALAVDTIKRAAVDAIFESAVDAEVAAAPLALVELIVAPCAKLFSTVANIAAFAAQVGITSSARKVGTPVLAVLTGLEAIVLEVLNLGL